MTRKLLAAAAIAATAIALAACGESAPEETAPQDPAPQDAEVPGMDQQGEMPDMPEPDVADVPDVVATVNDIDITGEEFVALYQMQFQQMAMESQMTGEEPDQDAMKDQTLNAMIDSELLVQDAEARGHEATEEDVEAVLEETAAANQIESVDELMEVYAEQGVTEELVRNDARTQILVESLIEDDLEVAEPTDEEVEEFFESMDMGAEEETEVSLEEARPELEDQLRNQNRGEAVQAHVGDLREGAEVQTHL